jgi:serine/threonine protein kinase
VPDYALVGRVFGPYRLIEGVGRGGMAEVYLAEDERLDRQVAVKILPAAMAMDQTFRARFEREARAAAKLQHPHILPVYDYGQQDGIPYLVMPYITGGSLSQIIAAARGPLPLNKIAQWIEEMASALQYAHDQGIIHRDVKPGNMLVGPGEHLLLSDFGIAKVMDTTTALTNTGTSVGSPEYMAPEQAKGGADYRSDIYALGIVLYQMLTGRVPFSASTPMQVMLQHVQEPPPAPRALNPALSPQIEAVVLHALAKDPNQRFQSASQLAEAFKAAVSGRPLPKSITAATDDLSTRLAAPGQTAAGARPRGSLHGQAGLAEPLSSAGVEHAPRRTRPRSPTAVHHPTAYPTAQPYAETGYGSRRAATRPRSGPPLEVAYPESAYMPAPAPRRGNGFLVFLLILLLLIALALGAVILYIYKNPNAVKLSLETITFFLQI